MLLLEKKTNNRGSEITENDECVIFTRHYVKLGYDDCLIELGKFEVYGGTYGLLYYATKRYRKMCINSYESV